MQRNGGAKPKLFWKSDASQAYCQLLMHLHWQVQQATLINGQYNVNRCAVFRNHASGHLWCLFSGLVCWIVIHKYGIAGLLHYVNDAFNISFNNKPSFYEPYKHWLPQDQAHFLKLLDHIGILHDDAKQVHGDCLEIIGFTIDANNLSISLSPESKKKLVDALCDFVLNMSENKHQQTLHSWLRMLGNANWALNIFPLLKPALNLSYDKISRKTIMSQSIYINKQVQNDLLWFVDSAECMKGIWILVEETWGADEADIQIWGDASKIGLAFCAPSLKVAFIGNAVIEKDVPFNIFDNDSLTIITAL